MEIKKKGNREKENFNSTKGILTKTNIVKSKLKIKLYSTRIKRK